MHHSPLRPRPTRRPRFPFSLRFLRWAAALALLLAVAPAALANQPEGGLALALHPEGHTLVAGGLNRTLYELDAHTLEVRARRYLGAPINALAFSADGARLFVESSAPDIYVLAADTLEPLATLNGWGGLRSAPAVDRFVAFRRAYEGDELMLFDGAGEALGELRFAPEHDVVAVGIDPQGKRVAVAFRGVESEDEKEVSYGDMPDGLAGFQRDVYRQQHDGRRARFLLLGAPTLKTLVDVETFYNPDQPQPHLWFQGDEVLMVNYRNLNARFARDGSVEMWQWPGDVSFAYGQGASPDHALLAVGGLRRATLVRLEDMNTADFRLDELPGWPEYFSDFAITGDGTVYAATDGFRVAKVTPDGIGFTQRVAPVF